MSYFGFPDQASAGSFFLEVPATSGVPGLDSYPTVFPSSQLLEEFSQPPEPNPLVLCAPWPFEGTEGETSLTKTEIGEPGYLLPSRQTVFERTWSYPGENGGWSLLQERSQAVSSPFSSSESQQSLSFFSASSLPDSFAPDGTTRVEGGGNTKSKNSARRHSTSALTGMRNNGILSVSERRARNKVASAKYREKKNRKEAEMSVAIEFLRTRCSYLERQVKTLSRENQLLRTGKGGEGVDKGDDADEVRMFSEEIGLCL